MIGCQVAVGGISAANLTDGYMTVVLRSASLFVFQAAYLFRALILIRCESIELYPPRVFYGTWSPPNRSQTSHTRTNVHEWSLQQTPLTFESTAFPLNAISLFLHLMLFYANMPGCSTTYIPANPSPRTGKRKLGLFRHLAANTGNNPRALLLATAEQ